MTYEELNKVNQELNKQDFKGSDYANVNERVNGFRKLHPMGSIRTDIISINEGVCIIKATVTDENGHILGQGTAYEKEGSSYINKTSYIENCETSAVGRALAFVGIGINYAIASAEEVENAKAQQAAGDKITKAQAETLKKSVTNYGIEDYILKKCKVKSIEELTNKQYKYIFDNWEAFKKEAKV